MKKHLCIFSALLIFACCVVSTAYAQEDDTVDAKIETLYNMGLSTWEIAELMGNPFASYNTNMLRLAYGMVCLELCSRNINPLEEMPADELAELLNAVTEKQKATEVTVPVGMYLVGKDIPAGDYTISHTGKPAATYEDTNYYTAPTITVYESNRKTEIMFFMANYNEPIGKLTLEDGQYVKVQRSPAVFTPYKGLDF